MDDAVTTRDRKRRRNKLAAQLKRERQKTNDEATTLLVDTLICVVHSLTGAVIDTLSAKDPQTALAALVESLPDPEVLSESM